MLQHPSSACTIDSASFHNPILGSEIPDHIGSVIHDPLPHHIQKAFEETRGYLAVGFHVLARRCYCVCSRFQSDIMYEEVDLGALWPLCDEKSDIPK